MRTVVYQSFRKTDVPRWIERCMTSAREWAQSKCWDYCFFGDEIFELTPPAYLEKTASRPQIATDLARLKLARELLSRGHERAVWLDADVLVFAPGAFDVAVRDEYAFGREIWVQRSAGGGLRTYRNVHNAVCVFCRGNSMLDFYIHACLSIVGRSDGNVPPQVVGTKFLTALHNIVGFPLIDDVAMLSPLVLADLISGGGDALALLRRKSAAGVHAANLCGSLVGRDYDDVKVTEAMLNIVCDRLLDGGGRILSDRPR